MDSTQQKLQLFATEIFSRMRQQLKISSENLLILQLQFRVAKNVSVLNIFISINDVYFSLY